MIDGKTAKAMFDTFSMEQRAEFLSAALDKGIDDVAGPIEEVTKIKTDMVMFAQLSDTGQVGVSSTLPPEALAAVLIGALVEIEKSGDFPVAEKIKEMTEKMKKDKADASAH